MNYDHIIPDKMHLTNMNLRNFISKTKSKCEEKPNPYEVNEKITSNIV